MPKTYAEIAARVRVPLGLLLGIIYVVFAQPTGRRLAWGAALAFAGLLLRASGAGHLAKNQTLATGGPYQYIRHPLYLGSILADRKSTRLNSSHIQKSRMPSSA